ncbi:MAG: alkaline phosphatase [Candidatus Hydrogenedentes bacterium]|nr:alkaline phosphatase [Candidatus Hydrogenedentota bacterium]
MSVRARLCVIISTCAALSLFAPACATRSHANAQSTAAAHATPVAKNVIVMVGDGFGFNHALASDYYEHGEAGKHLYEREFTNLAMSTYSVNVEGGYDLSKAWTSFDYFTKASTDSAAAASAMSTGVKTKNGAIGVDVDGKSVKHIAEHAEELGKSSGVITTVPISHATPAGFSAHDASRSNYDVLARQMILDSKLDVIMGGGHPLFDADGKPRVPSSAEGKEYRYVGGQETWNKILAGSAGGDADGDGTPDLWTLVQSREEFQKLGSGDAPKRVLGLVQSAESTQVDRSGIDDERRDDAPYQTPLLETSPTLAEMSKAALNVLDSNPKGFFLMIEGGAIDWASHANAGGRMIEEVSDFNRAIEAVAEWVSANSSWDETLVIVTADHETGYIWGPGSNPDWKPLENKGKGVMPGIQFNSKGHSNNLVPFFVKGAGAEYVASKAVQTDKKRGPFLDNTDIAKSAMELMR